MSSQDDRNDVIRSLSASGQEQLRRRGIVLDCQLAALRDEDLATLPPNDQVVVRRQRKGRPASPAPSELEKLCGIPVDKAAPATGSVAPQDLPEPQEEPHD